MMKWNELISVGNLYKAWKNFSTGKKQKRDVMCFGANVEDELFLLHNELRTGTYRHGGYQTFKVFDPKERVIHKATVRDRVVHRMLYDYLMSIFNKTWLDCSFSCRPGRGQFRSIYSVDRALRQSTRNYTRIGWAVKCDVRKFFDNIDHNILFDLLCSRVYDVNIRSLLKIIIESFFIHENNRGLPIGNLTSQVFANVYLHELDMFAKHTLKERYYFRYADDCAP